MEWFDLVFMDLLPTLQSLFPGADPSVQMIAALPRFPFPSDSVRSAVILLVCSAINTGAEDPRRSRLHYVDQVPFCAGLIPLTRSVSGRQYCCCCVKWRRASVGGEYTGASICRVNIRRIVNAIYGKLAGFSVPSPGFGAGRAGVVVLILNDCRRGEFPLSGAGVFRSYRPAIGDYWSLLTPCAESTPAFQQHVDKSGAGDREGLQDGPKASF